MGRPRQLAALVCILAAAQGCSPDYSPNTYSANAVQQANKVERGVVIGYRQVKISANGTVGAVTGGAAGGVLGGTAGARGASAALGAVGDRRHRRHRCRAYGSRHDRLGIHRQETRRRACLGHAARADAAAGRAESPGDRRQSGAHSAGLCRDRGRIAGKARRNERANEGAATRGGIERSSGTATPGSRSASASDAARQHIGDRTASGTGRSLNNIALRARATAVSSSAVCRAI